MNRKNILFLLGAMTEEEFLAMPGIRELFEECKEHGWRADFIPVEGGAFAGYAETGSSTCSPDFILREAGQLDDQLVPEPGVENGWGEIRIKNERSPAFHVEQENLIITDSRKIAAYCEKKNICCIGYQQENSSDYFPGTSTVLTSFCDISLQFFYQTAQHFHGLPAVIAKTDRLVIRESCREDFAALYQISRQEKRENCSDLNSDRETEELEKFLAYIRTAYHYFGYGLWTVLERESGQIIGRCGFNPVETQGEMPQEDMMQVSLELGYLIHPEYRRKGYAFEACQAALQYAREELGTEKIYALIHRENAASQKLAEKLQLQRILWKDRKKIIMDVEENKEIWYRNLTLG